MEPNSASGGVKRFRHRVSFPEPVEHFSGVRDEQEAFVDQSVSMRRVFSRWKRPIPIIGLDGSLFKILPKSDGTLHPAKYSDFPPHKVFASDKNYREEIEAYGYEVEDHHTLKPDWSVKEWWNL